MKASIWKHNACSVDVRAIFQRLHPVPHPQPNEVSDEVCLKGDRGNTPDAGQFSISCGNGSAGPDETIAQDESMFFYYVYMISSSSLVMHLCRAGHPCFCLCQFARERDNHLDPGVLVGVLTWNITCKLAHVVVSLAEDGHGKGHVP